MVEFSKYALNFIIREIFKFLKIGGENFKK